MEDIIAYVIIVLVLVVPICTGIVIYRRNKRKQAQSEVDYDRSMKDVRLAKTIARTNGSSLSKTTVPKVEPTKSYATANNSSYSTTTASNDSLLSDLATLYVLNSALQHGSASAKVDYDTGTIKTDNSSSSSWGLDDSDSRKSASDSFSSSSWSDSSSSSDSGPSSDW